MKSTQQIKEIIRDIEMANKAAAIGFFKLAEGARQAAEYELQRYINEVAND